MMLEKIKNIPALVVAVALMGFIFLGALPKTYAQQEGFSLQVSPSPLIATVAPGETTQLELKIRNTNTQRETLKMGLSDFSVDPTSGDIELNNTVDSVLEKLAQFSDPIFTLNPGEWFTQKITISVPSDTGFGYNFAVTVSRETAGEPARGESRIEGTVAVFTLLTVDKPGAIRSLEITDFSSGKSVYEYLPATFSVTIKNTGNVNVQPKGNIFIKRNADDTAPLSTLTLNDQNGYILPGTERVFTTTWNEGFPLVVTNLESTETNLEWDFSNAANFRIGDYTAHLVALYDDGQRDVSVTGQVSFRVLPWKQLALIVVAVLFMVIGVFFVFKSILGKINPIKKKKPSDTTST